MLLSSAEITSWTGSTDTDPTGLAVDGDLLYFFEDDTVPGLDIHNAARALIRYDRVLDEFTTWFSQDRFWVAAGLVSGNFVAEDISVDPLGLVHVATRDRNTAIEHLFRISGEGIGSVSIMGTAADGIIAIDFDPSSGRLYALTSTDDGAVGGGLEYLDFSSFPAAGFTQLATDASLEAALTSTGAAEWNPSDLVVRGDGDILIFNGGPNTGSGGDIESDGDCIRVTPAGAVSLHFDRSLLDALLGDLGTTGYGPAALEVTSDDDLLILAFETDPGGATTVEEFLAKVNEAGNAAEFVTEEFMVLSDLGTGTDLSFTAHGFAIDDAGNGLWSSNGANQPQGILQISGPLPVALSAFGSD